MIANHYSARNIVPKDWGLIKPAGNGQLGLAWVVWVANPVSLPLWINGSALAGLPQRSGSLCQCSTVDKPGFWTTWVVGSKGQVLLDEMPSRNFPLWLLMPSRPLPGILQASGDQARISIVSAPNSPPASV